jgi:hypothetical protein
MDWWHHFIAENEGPITIATILVSLGAFTSGLVWWILTQLKGSIDGIKTSVDKNSTLLVSLIEVQIVRATQAAKEDSDVKGIVDMVKTKFEDAKK